jgi:lysophospholipase L1-like esterase
VLLVLAGALAGCLLAEVALRVASSSRPYRVLPAGLRLTFVSRPGVMPGVRGPSVFSTNEAGIRADPLPHTDAYEILAVGGSTTECAYLDDGEAWPYLLQGMLNGAGLEPPVWVGNVGRSGHSVVENILVVRHFVPQVEVDAVIVIAGINDLMTAWRIPAFDPTRHTPEAPGRYLHRAFARRPWHDVELVRRFPGNLALFNLVELAYWQAVGAAPGAPQRVYVEDSAGEAYVRRRALYRNAARQIDTLPDLEAALDQYERNLRALVDEAEQQGLRLVLATQPAIYRDGLSEAAAGLLWFGLRQGGEVRYSPAVMRRALALFNARMLKTCAARGVECVDLAAAMSGVERYFYDDVHFNEAGAAAVAELLAEHFRSVPTR